VPRITDFCSCIYVLGCKLSVVRLCDSDFGITSVDIIIIIIVIDKNIISDKVMPISVAARSKAWVSCGSLAGVAGSNLAGGMDVFSFANIVCREAEVSVSG